MSSSLFKQTLAYGTNGRFELELLDKRVQLHKAPPPSLEDVETAIDAAFADPLDFPSLDRAFVPDDSVAVVMDHSTPASGMIVNALIELFEHADLSLDRIQFLEPVSINQRLEASASLHEEMLRSEEMGFHRHDPAGDDACAYLANTAAGERVYISRELTEADALLTVGPVGFHPVLGVHGTASSIYPGLSKTEDLARSNARGHDELGPLDPRPLRQMAEEVAWLIGLQMSVAVVPAAGRQVHRLFVGQSDSVFRQASQALIDGWTVTAPQRAEMVIVSVPSDAGGHGWWQVGAAIDAARRLVERNGRIIVLSELDEPIGPGLEILTSTRSPRDALKPISRAAPRDLLTASRIASAADWANVSLLSKLPAETVDDLFMLPLESEQEVQRLIQQDDLTAVLENAQHCYVCCEG